MLHAHGAWNISHLTAFCSELVIGGESGSSLR
uniref:Uncharacterized protein n=1 Tax=Anguilla anguilla TaxID=7936 RepID=A0A0E9T5W8_ANGAN